MPKDLLPVMGISLEGATNARADAKGTTQNKARWADLFDEVEEENRSEIGPDYMKPTSLCQDGSGKLGPGHLDQVVIGNTPPPADTKPCALQKEDWRAKKLDAPVTLLSSASRAKGRGLRWCVKVPNSAGQVAPDVQPVGNKKSAEAKLDASGALEAWEDGSVDAKNGKKKQCQFIIGIEEDPVFRVGRRLLGPNGSNMKSIAAKTGCRLRLRGRGSWFLEGPYQQESTDPLMLCVSSPTDVDHAEAVRLIEELLQSVYAEFRAFCKSAGWRIPDLRIRRNEGARKGAR